MQIGIALGSVSAFCYALEVDTEISNYQLALYSAFQFSIEETQLTPMTLEACF